MRRLRLDEVGLLELGPGPRDTPAIATLWVRGVIWTNTSNNKLGGLVRFLRKVSSESNRYQVPLRGAYCCVMR